MSELAHVHVSVARVCARVCKSACRGNLFVVAYQPLILRHVSYALFQNPMRFASDVLGLRDQSVSNRVLPSTPQVSTPGLGSGGPHCVKSVATSSYSYVVFSFTPSAAGL